MHKKIIISEKKFINSFHKITSQFSRLAFIKEYKRFTTKTVFIYNSDQIASLCGVKVQSFNYWVMF